MAELDFVGLETFVLLRNVVEMNFGRLDKIVLLGNMVEMDFDRLNNLYYFVTWKNWILVD